MAAESGDLRIVMLGTGTSHGVPMIGCDCAVCTSHDPCDKRTRPSIVIQSGDQAILVDTTPELRLQCLANGISTVNAVLFTHAHADHVTGLDDLRRFNWINQSALRCYGSDATLGQIRRMFAYAFDDDPDYPSHKPDLQLREIDHAPFDVAGMGVLPIPLLHGAMPVLGFRVGKFAYCTDCSEIPEGSWERLAGLDVLVLDALRKHPHPTHFNLEQAVEAAGRIGARQTYFTHIAHQLGHADTNASLPAGMALAHDGLMIHVSQA